MQDIAYIELFKYDMLDGTGSKSFISSTATAIPTGEVQVVQRINPINTTSSSPAWVNDTVEAFRSCPLYGSANGGDNIIIIGRNFRDTRLNYCKFRACYSSNSGSHPRRCRNQVNDALGQPLSAAGNVSAASYIARAKFISSTRIECPTPEFLFTQDFNPDPTVVYYSCQYINAFGNIESSSGSGNLSYVRRCSPTSLYTCPDKPNNGEEFFNSLTFRCTPEEIYNKTCSNMPEYNSSYVVEPVEYNTYYLGYMVVCLTGVLLKFSVIFLRFLSIFYILLSLFLFIFIFFRCSLCSEDNFFHFWQFLNLFLIHPALPPTNFFTVSVVY